ncbi:MAG TPA: ABC transporter permease [Gemmatimonadaceae bacterium]|nr:ABC transporter permease [Gemmatimonadaceae bacterium]
MTVLPLLRHVRDAFVLYWLVVSLTFVLVRLAPGDPATMLVPADASAAEVARIRHEFGLDRSMPVQYARWLEGVLTGHLGESFATHEPVTHVLARALPVSAGLGAASLLLTILIGVPIGLLQGARPGSAGDHTLTILTTTVYAMPSFWIALALVAVFTYGASMLGFPDWLRLPAFGVQTPGAGLSGFDVVRDVARHAILPVAILAAIGAAGIARYARSSVADLRGQDFVRTARAKGLGTGGVYLRHVLANALPPLVVLVALALPGLVAGSVFVESVFAWPGMGRALLGAIGARDYPVVMASTLVYAGVVIVANLAADLVLPLLDPRRAAP